MEQFKEKCKQYLLMYYDLDILKGKKFGRPSDIQKEKSEVRKGVITMLVYAVVALACYIGRWFARNNMSGIPLRIVNFLLSAAGIVLIIMAILWATFALTSLRSYSEAKKNNEKLEKMVADHKKKVEKLSASCNELYKQLAKERESFPELAGNKYFFDYVKGTEIPEQNMRRWSEGEKGALNLGLRDVYSYTRGVRNNEPDYKVMDIKGNYRKGKACLISEIMPYFDPKAYFMLYCDREYIANNPDGECAVWELESWYEEMIVDKAENVESFYPEQALEIVETERTPLERFIYSGLNGTENLSQVPDDRCYEDSYQSSELVTSETIGYYRSKILRIHRYGYIVRTPDRSRIICAVAPLITPPEYKIAFNFGDRVSLDEAYGYRMGEVIGMAHDSGSDANEIHAPAEVMQHCAFRSSDGLKAVDVLTPVPKTMSNAEWVACLASIIHKRETAKRK